MVPGFLFDSLPWWLAAPLLQLGLLALGMALDETYVNRTTVLTGALALYVHTVVAGGAWLLVGLYLDVGIAIGVYGLYAYVVDAYVPNWFRVAAYFCYSPLAILLVVLLPDVAFPVALALAGYANLQLMAYLEPSAPYYFGPASPDEFEDAVAETSDPVENAIGADGEARTGDPGAAAAAGSNPPADSLADGAGAGGPGADGPGAEPTGTGRSTERGILPEFMRRL